MKKAAVVIGVNKTKDGALAVLESAAAGAKRVASWLDEEGYDVICLTDESEPVTASLIFNGISEFASLPVQYDMLLVYFSGHGYWLSRSDYWLLSGAPNNPNESVNLLLSMELAKYSGIPNVVFISDACRSIPKNRSGQLLGGNTIFPNLPEVNTLSKIDFFKATSEALPAYEVKIDGKSRSVLTHALISAYAEPDTEMITELDTADGSVLVVPNRKLEGFLQRKVNSTLSKISMALNQRLEINVPSDDQTYIARVGDGVEFSTVKSILAPTEEGTRNLEDFSPQLSTKAIFSRKMDRKRIAAMIPDMSVDHFESENGFVVYGATVRNSLCTKGKRNARVEVVANGDSIELQGLIRVWNVAQAVSVLIELDDGRSVILPSLQGYIGHAQFDGDGLINVSYLPSSNNWRWQMIQGNLDEINELRAEVAQATEDNAFSLESSGQAQELAQKIRVGKSIDPSLGLYAATAFAQASMEDRVRSVMDYMHNDLDVDLFDVRLLSSRNPEIPLGADNSVTPICPMLTQNWHLLDARGVKLPAVIEKAKPFLSNALWTTFEAAVTKSLITAFNSGELE